MKASLLFICQAALTASTVAQTIPFQTFDTCGSVQTATVNSDFSSITGSWSYPSTLFKPIFEPGNYFFTQYIAIDLLPNTCADFLQVETNITLDSLYPSTGTEGGFGFYIWNNITTPITDDNGDVVQFLSGDSVIATISVTDNGQGAAVTFNSTSSGPIEISLDGGALCFQDVQWAIGSATDQVMAGFDFVYFQDCTASQTGTSGSLTPEGGYLVNLVLSEDEVDDIQAQPEELSGEGFKIEFQPDD